MRASLVTRHSGSINTAPTRLLLLLVILAASWSADALAVGAATQLLAAAQRGDEARVLQLKTEFDSKPKPARGDKKTARALNEEALELLRSGDFPTAIERLTAASKADSGDAEVLGNLGYAYLMIQRFSDAKTALERALELAPTRTATWASLGETYAGLGDEPAAI
jgi:Flp pilus assembly protein TadD